MRLKKWKPLTKLKIKLKNKLKNKLKIVLTAEALSVASRVEQWGGSGIRSLSALSLKRTLANRVFL